MQIAVTFRHIEADEGVKGYVKDKVQRLQRYIENPREVHVVLSGEKFRHTAEMTIVGNGMTLNSQGRDSDLYAAIDRMVEKLQRQIRERREKERKKRPSPVSSKRSTRAGREVMEGKEETELSSLVQRRRIVAKPMSLEEAVAQLEVSRNDFFVFMNSDSGQVNVLSRSKDGGYEWVEPHQR